MISYSKMKSPRLIVAMIMILVVQLLSCCFRPPSRDLTVIDNGHVQEDSDSQIGKRSLQRITSVPNTNLTVRPSSKPTTIPGFNAFSSSPSISSVEEVEFPTHNPSLTTTAPSSTPSTRPTMTMVTSMYPSISPSLTPSSSNMPSITPSSSPSLNPSLSNMPSITPSISPSLTPSSSNMPSITPSSTPSTTPTLELSSTPSITPSSTPTKQVSESPSSTPSTQPTITPSDSKAPSSTPSISPTHTPTSALSGIPSSIPSSSPSSLPTSDPSEQPSKIPSARPTSIPTAIPSLHPTTLPSTHPSRLPSLFPSPSPSRVPSLSPTDMPTSIPSLVPSDRPSSSPTRYPINSIEIANAVRQNNSLASSSSVYSETIVGFIVIGSLSVIAIIGIILTRSSIQEIEIEDIKDDDCSSISCDDPISLNPMSPQISIVGSYSMETEDSNSPNKLNILNSMGSGDSFVIGRPVWSPNNMVDLDEEVGEKKDQESSPIIIGQPVWSPNQSSDQNHEDKAPLPPSGSPSSPSAAIASFFSNVGKNFNNSQVAGSIRDSIGNIFGGEGSPNSSKENAPLSSRNKLAKTTSEISNVDENEFSDKFSEKSGFSTNEKDNIEDDNVSIDHGVSLGLSKMDGWIMDDVQNKINIETREKVQKAEPTFFSLEEKSENESWDYSSVENSDSEG